MSTASWPAARPSPPGLAIDRDASLRDYNSFGLPATARTLVHITSDADVRRLLAHPEHGRAPKLVLGGGSNLILSRDPQAVVLRVEVRGRRLVAERPDAWIVEAGAGERWHDVVAWTLDQGWPGLENLSLIPGTVGAAPIQNIGAYGAQVGDFIQVVEAWDRQEQAWVRLDQEACRFSYRDSLFKHEADRYLIVAVEHSGVQPQALPDLVPRGSAEPNPGRGEESVVGVLG